MADKLMRTAVVMSFFLILALFSGCGTNGTSLSDVDKGRQISVQPADTVTITPASNPAAGYSW